MTEPDEFRFYNVTYSQAEERSARLDLHFLGEIPFDLGRRLSTKDGLSFEPGQTRLLPLNDYWARQVADLRQFRVEQRGDGTPHDAAERELLDLVRDRETAVREARVAVYPFLKPWGDYAKAALVHRLFSFSQLELEEIDRVPERFEVSAGFCEELRTVAETVRQVREELEAKGWHFDGREVKEPSTGGRPASFPRNLIRAVYQSMATRTNHSGQGGDVLEAIQGSIRPFVGDVPLDEIREAVKEGIRRR